MQITGVPPLQIVLPPSSYTAEDHQCLEIQTQDLFLLNGLITTTRGKDFTIFMIQQNFLIEQRPAVPTNGKAFAIAVFK
jgi:hypothetical protein